MGKTINLKNQTKKKREERREKRRKKSYAERVVKVPPRYHKKININYVSMNTTTIIKRDREGMAGKDRWWEEKIRSLDWAGWPISAAHVDTNPLCVDQILISRLYCI